MSAIGRLVGWILYKINRQPGHSTSICGTLTAGYGVLDDYGFWQFPVPHDHWRGRSREATKT